MDKNLNQLDPKLKEAYDRVMGTNVKPSPPTSQPMSQISSSEPQKAETNVTQTQAPASAPVQTQTTQSGAHVFTKITPNQKKKKRISPLLIVFGVLIFAIAYSVVWVKYFNLQVPILNP